MMDNIPKIADSLSTFSSIAVSLAAIIGLLSMVFKPVRDGVMWVIRRIYGTKKNEMISAINNVKDELCEKMDTMQQSISNVSEKVDDNERDRLRTEIFSYGNRARKGEEISGEEFRRLQEIFQKYEEKLHGNGIAREEFSYITSYYNESGWQKHNDDA